MFSLLFGCSSFSQFSDYEKIADEITERTAKELKAEKNLYLVGTGGQMMDDIQMMAMSFYYYQEVDLKAARELIVYVINKYLLAINSNKEIRPSLHEYPFTAKNVEISIFIYKPDRYELPPEKIYCIECMNGRLEYFIRANPRQAIYEEALQAISSKIATHVPEAKFLQISQNEGSLEVYKALLTSPKSVQRRIISAAFAPTVIIPEELCFKSYNYISRQDCVTHLDILKLKYGNQLQILDPHPNANFWDHEFLIPIFEDQKERIIINYIKNYGSKK
jgi:hypothetical protein